MSGQQPGQPPIMSTMEAMDRIMLNFKAEMERLGATSRVLTDIRAERKAQDERWGEQNHPDVSDFPLKTAGERRVYFATFAAYCKQENDRMVAAGTLDWAGILLEEVHEALAESDPALLRAELVQVAAVATCWAEAIDRREAQKKEES